MALFGTPSCRRPKNLSVARRFTPRVEALEPRLVPYSASGSAWPHPELITLSFVPDGTLLGSNSSGYIYSNLFATFNARWGTGVWQKQILKAAQFWAQQTNLNFAVVPDNGATLGTGNYQQGDPSNGDIRISGFNFNDGYLAVAEMPPPANNYSIAGDVSFNTGQPYNIGSTYDLYSVALHEMGHALGMDHSSLGTAVMYASYTNTKSGLNSDDIAGIRSIYSNGAPRSFDVYNAAGRTSSFATAANLNPQIDPSALTALVTNLDLTVGGQVNYYTFNAPAGTTGTLTLNLQSSGLSLLAPTVTVYAADQATVLGSASGAGHYGTTLTVTVNGVTAGQQLYVKVAGAEATPLGTGKYALTLNFGSGPSPTVPLPNTQTANGTTQSSGGGEYQSTGSSGGLLGCLVQTGAAVTDGLVGSLLGISTKFGLGAGVGDPMEAPPDLTRAFPLLLAEGGLSSTAAAPLSGRPAVTSQTPGMTAASRPVFVPSPAGVASTAPGQQFAIGEHETRGPGPDAWSLIPDSGLDEVAPATLEIEAETGPAQGVFETPHEPVAPRALPGIREADTRDGWANLSAACFQDEDWTGAASDQADDPSFPAVGDAGGEELDPGAALAGLVLSLGSFRGAPAAESAEAKRRLKIA